VRASEIPAVPLKIGDLQFTQEDVESLMRTVDEAGACFRSRRPTPRNRRQAKRKVQRAVNSWIDAWAESHVCTIRVEGVIQL
jgi:hypothetical protein